jgi:hypothetical protein
VQSPVVENTAVVNVATPATAVAVTGAAKHVELTVIESVEAEPVVSTLPLASSTETLKAVIAVPVVNTAAGGATVKASFAGVPPLTNTAELEVAVITLFVESDAIRMQLPTWLMDTALKDATPATSATEVVPPTEQEELIAIVSVAPVARFPYWSSLDTLKSVRATSAPPVAGGSVVNANLFAAAGVTGMLCEIVPPVGESVATRLHEPVLAPPRMIPVNATEDPEYGSVVVPPVTLQFVDVMTMLSVPDVPPLTVTLKPKPVFATAAPGRPVNPRVAAAEAGSTPMNATPASTRAATDPSPTTDPNFDLMERALPVRPKCIPITSPSSGRDHSSE